MIDSTETSLVVVHCNGSQDVHDFSRGVVVVLIAIEAHDNHAPNVKVIANVRTTPIDGNGASQEAINQLLGEIISLLHVLYRDMEHGTEYRELGRWRRSETKAPWKRLYTGVPGTTDIKANARGLLCVGALPVTPPPRGSKSGAAVDAREYGAWTRK